MFHQQKGSEMARRRLPAMGAAIMVLAFLATLTPPADARGHGFGRGFGGGPGLGGHGMQGAPFAGDRRRGDDAYVKAASDENDKLLNSKLKSICRGC
jgi:hypothetical protein